MIHFDSKIPRVKLQHCMRYHHQPSGSIYIYIYNFAWSSCWEKRTMAHVVSSRHLSPRSPRFSTRLIHMETVVEKMALRKGFHQILWISIVSIIPPLLRIAMETQQLTASLNDTWKKNHAGSMTTDMKYYFQNCIINLLYYIQTYITKIIRRQYRISDNWYRKCSFCSYHFRSSHGCTAGTVGGREL